MPTLVLKIDPFRPASPELEEAAAILAAGGTVAFPTETVYGLGADALRPEAVHRIFEAKGRPADNPLIVHVATLAHAEALAEFTPEARKLAERFWPGPLTLVLPRKVQVPDVVTAGLSTVALRIPAHPVALALLKVSRVPVAAPSANRSGRPSPTRAEDVLADLEGRINAVVDGGAVDIGLESTVLDLTAQPPAILRPGGVSREALESIVGPVVEGAQGTASEAPKAPGMKYVHYAPVAPLILFEGEEQAVWTALSRKVAELRGEGKRVGVLCGEEYAATADGDVVVSFGPLRRPEQIARHLYESLRAFDQSGVNVIVAEGIAEEGIGAAVMNRLRKAASKVEKV